MSDALRHHALFYRGDSEYLAAITAFVRTGLAAGESVEVAVPGRRHRLLRDALGRDAASVHFIDMASAGRNPGRIIPVVLRAFSDAQAPGRPVRIVDEPMWPGRSVAEYPACVQHEALVNNAFDEKRRVIVLCPYDAAGLAPAVLADARSTHPEVTEGGRTEVSRGYAPQGAVESYNTPLHVPPGAAWLYFDRQGLREARRFAVEVAGGLGTEGSRLDDLALAVAELTTNSVLHGGGSGMIRLWLEGGNLVCEVLDGGRMTDRLAGRIAPPPGRPGGRGLLMVNQLADLVREYTGPSGTAIRFYLALRSPAAGRGRDCAGAGAGGRGGSCGGPNG